MLNNKNKNIKTLPLRSAYKTKRGVMLIGSAENILRSPLIKKYIKKTQLIFTSPPFPLNRKKKYGNLQGEDYIKWFSEFAPIFRKLLKRNGSIVIEMGNAWHPGKPIMSTLALKALLAFLESGNFYLCQQFVSYNPSKLPGPAQWVNIDRCRVKDSYTHIWWMSPGPYPKADNRKILKKYSNAMINLLSSKKYNAGKRPSEHKIGKISFLRDNKGAIPSNVLTFSNTTSNDDYLNYCRKNKFRPHPARMPLGLAQFFIKFLTNPKDLIIDPFAGSNTTGAVSEDLKRQWISIESDVNYVRSSYGRFKKDKK